MKKSNVWCIYNSKDALMAVGTSEEDAWMSLLSPFENELSEYFKLVKQGYYSQIGVVSDLEEK